MFLGLCVDEPGGFSTLCPLGSILLTDGSHSCLGLDAYRFPSASGFQKLAELVQNVLNYPTMALRRPVTVVCSEAGVDMLLKTFRRYQLGVPRSFSSAAG